jgi:hypothetical protein
MDVKPFASLTSGLLARKGQAKPAMRPQSFGNFAGSGHSARDDLGWNDMGHDRPRPQAPAPTPAPDPVKIDVEAVSGPSEPKRRAAFTLRLDRERHVRLRLAAVAQNCSGQQVLVKALDRFLADIPELDELAGRLPPRGSA